ncbi:MAG TPA: AAA family ATPase, partial [Longimicrobiales bacterium]|nr:AAA family ATPase [Longimicrobiales bacterium]
MRIDRILVEGFGRLRDLDTGPAALDGLVVVVGPNEAGKSTLFTFLTTALYGFQPAARERNPHVPWGAAEAAGRIRIQLDAGGCGEVERRLRSQPSGRLTLDGASSELRNQPLPWVEHVPRTVFRQVFAVTLGELADLDSETWARIHDKLVGTMGASDLGSARSVADTLEREAGEIWRPNRRGNQRLRALQAEGRALRTRRAAALDRDAKVRAMTEKREQAERRLEAAREQRQRDRLSIERTQTLQPLAKTLARIAALREAGGSRDVLRGLPADPPGRL